MKQIQTEAQEMAQAETTSARALARLLGMMNAKNSAIPPAPLFCCQFANDPLQHPGEALKMLWNKSHSYPGEPTRAGMVESQYVLLECKTFLKREVDLTIDSDASLQG